LFTWDPRDLRVVLEIDDDRAALVVAAQPSSGCQRRVAERPVGLAPARLVGRKRIEDRLLEQPGMLGAAQLLAGAGRRAAVARDSPAGGGEDLDVQLAEAGRDGHGLASQSGRDAVVVVLERDECRAADDALNLKLRRERRRRQSEQPLSRASSAIVLAPRLRRSATATAHRSRSACAWPSDETGAVRHHDW
jgi:hypothetical protein